MTITVEEIVAVILGQGDGEFFVSDAAIATVQKMAVSIHRDEARSGYVVRLTPAQRDGDGCGR